jgi:hypothetical protein
MTTQPMRLFNPGLKEPVGKRAQAVRLSPTTQNEVSKRVAVEMEVTVNFKLGS